MRTTSVIFRTARRLSRPDEAELRPRESLVHVFDVLALRLAVVGCVIRTGNKDLIGREETGRKDEHLTRLRSNLSCGTGGNHYLTLSSILIGNQQVGDGDESESHKKCCQLNEGSVRKETRASTVSLTFARWAPEAPALAALLFRGFWSPRWCSLWRCTSRLRPRRDCRTRRIYKCLRGQKRSFISERC